MAKKILYIDGVTGLGEQEGDGWAYGPRFQVPPGDEKGQRKHVFINQGRFFSDALGGDYNVWFGDTSYIVPKDLSAGHYPWIQFGGWMRMDAPPATAIAKFPFDAYRPRQSGAEWQAVGKGFALTAGELKYGTNASGVYSYWVPGKWKWFEARVYSHTTAGTAELRVDETVIKRWTGISTITTSGTSPPTGEIGVNSAIFQINDWYTTTYQPYYDDLYVMLADTEGELDWLGKSVCEPLYVKGNGDENDGTPRGPDSWNSVNFPIVDGLYITSGVGDRDCFAMSNMEADRTRTVHGLKVTVRARKNNPEPVELRPYVRVSGTNYYGDTQYASPEWREYVHIWRVNPDTGNPWTREEVDAVQAGFERVS